MHPPPLQGVECPDGSPYTPPRLWRDLYDSIQAAQKFLYIAGWSVDTKVRRPRRTMETGFPGFKNKPLLVYSHFSFSSFAISLGMDCPQMFV